MDYDEMFEPDVCGRDLTIGRTGDRYGTGCDLPPRHSGDHAGPDSFIIDARITWTGGGSCAGDPLPYRITSPRVPATRRPRVARGRA